MKTFLAQNEFISGSASVPFAKSEAASLIAPHDAATLSDGVGAKPILASSPSEAATDPGRAVAATLHHNAITQAVEIQSSCGVVEGNEPVAVKLVGECRNEPIQRAFEGRSEVTTTRVAGIKPGPQDHIHDLEQLIGVAGKRRRRPLALPRFAPDFPALWHAMHDKNAPRKALDPLWADASPMFLQDVR